MPDNLFIKKLSFRIAQVLLLFFLIGPFFAKKAQARNCYFGMYDCNDKGKDFTSGNSGTGGKVKINPSAVPIEKGFGVEAIYFSSEADFGLVRGNGRIGAAISPSNSEDTFFGPPGFEFPFETLERKIEAKKFPSQKVTLATAFSVAEKKGSTFSSYHLRAGAMAKYNRLTHNAAPGFGISGALGPFTFGGSAYDDETMLGYEYFPVGEEPVLQYKVRTYNVGLSLSSLVLDYSNLRVQYPDVAIVKLYTASLFVGKFIFTASKRIEDNELPAYNFETKTLETKQIKEENFGGIQYSFSDKFMLGFLYNYYLLHEYSATLTIFL